MSASSSAATVRRGRSPESGMNYCSECESRRVAKRQRRCYEEDDDQIDRISYLPSSVMYHILSFLDTKEAVQTTVLSRVWRCAWKHVPVLILHRNSFPTVSSFMKFVDKVLSLHYNLEALKISYVDGVSNWNKKHQKMLSRVISYALAHSTQHFVLALEVRSNFSDLVGLMVDNCSFRDLEVENVTLNGGCTVSAFQQLSTLTLRNFLFGPGREVEEPFDPFSGFPCLENLVLEECFGGDHTGGRERFRISGHRLLSLRIVLIGHYKLEISAPKLESFTYVHYIQPLEFPDLYLPALGCADITFGWRTFEKDNRIDLAARNIVGFFQGLHNVKSMKLRPYTVEALNEISDFLEQHSSSFKRLENLYVEADEIPHEVTSFFLKGSLVQHQVSLF